jgi:hypothetical protein
LTASRRAHAGLGGGAQRFETVFIGGDGLFRRLRILQRDGGSGGVHGGAVFSQCPGARFGVGPAFGGAGGLGFGLDAGDGFLDRLHFHGRARGRGGWHCLVRIVQGRAPLGAE